MENYKNSIALFIELENRYAVDARLLGHRIRINISEDYYLRVIIPSLVLKNRCLEIEVPGIKKKYKADLSDWGTVKSYVSLDNIDRMDVWISAVVVECFGKDGDSLPKPGIIQAKAKKVIHSLQIINPDAIRVPSDEYKDDLCEVKMSVYLSEGGEAQPEIKCAMIFDDRKGKLSITDIKNAFRNAYNPISAPYEMLNNARINYVHHDTRATVLNCATAIEVMLKKMVSAYLKENEIPQALCNYVLKQADGFDKLVDLCKKLDICLEGMPIIKDFVMKIRNRVIHGGYIPSDEESQVAYNNTRETLKTLNVPMFELNNENN